MNRSLIRPFPIRWLVAAMLLLALGLAPRAWAVSLQLDRVTTLGAINHAGSFSASLDAAAGGALLRLSNGSGDLARITRIFIQDLDPVLQQGAAGAAPPITLTGTFTEGLRFDLRLDSGGANKLAVVRIVKDFTGLGLKESKDLVDQAPTVLLQGVPQDQADAFRTALVEAGASVSALPLNDSVGMLINLPFKQVVGGYDLVLGSGGANKLTVVRIVKDITGLGLKEAKDLVDAAPSLLLHDVDPTLAADLKAQLMDAGATVVLNPISKTISFPIELPAGSHVLQPGVEVRPDYKGHVSNPDLYLGLPLDGSFAGLLGAVAGQRFRLGLEVTDATGADLYLLAPVPEPETWLMWLGGALLLGGRRLRVRSTRASSTGRAHPALRAG